MTGLPVVGKKYHKAVSPPIDDPLAALEALAQARDILLALNDCLPEWLWDRLLQCPGQGKEVIILFDSFRDVDYLEALHQAKARLYEAVLPKSSFLILDRDIGWQVPSLQRLVDPFSLSCRLLWSRMGAVISVQGSVTDLRENFIRLHRGGSHYLWVSLGNLAIPAGQQPDRDIAVLGIYSFLSSWYNPIVSPLKITVAEGKRENEPFSR